jgi:histidinol-phosphate aminotransferase
MTGDFADQRAQLRHHGDVDAAPGMSDFAVNVALDRPPDWLLAELTAELAGLGRYPSAESARPRASRCCPACAPGWRQ